MDVGDGVALGGHFFAGFAGDIGGVVGAVVEHLDFEFVLGVVDVARGVDDASATTSSLYIGNCTVTGQFVEPAGGLVAVVSVLEIKVDQNVAMEAVEAATVQK